MIRIALCTCPVNAGERVARALVDARVAACVNISAPIKSVFRWKGNVDTADEVMLTIKLPMENVMALHEVIKKEHPYELPEVLVLAPDEPLSSATYLAWVRAESIGSR